MKNSIFQDSIPLLVGFIISVSISLVIVLILIIYENQHQKDMQTPTITVAATNEYIINTPDIITLSATNPVLLQITSTPELTVAKLIEKAQNYIDEGTPGEAKKLLVPVVAGWVNTSDKAAGYKLLGDSEMSMGHSQLASPYYEKVYYYDPIPENLFLLAYTYDLSGDLHNALARYKELDAWVDPNAQIDREFIKFRIEDINLVNGTKPAPKPTSTK